jgi:hypothetical protein
MEVPFLISRRVLCGRKRKPIGRACVPWVLDSGGFSELSLFGRWRTSPQRYAREAAQWSRSVGRLEWAAIQDWMCEPFILARTGHTLRYHQEKTIESYFVLSELEPDVPWLPVLQGWTTEDYIAHIEMYQKSGIDVSLLPIVGVGSVCRRQGTGFASDLFAELSAMGVKCHAFGVKVTGFRSYAAFIESADSMAWSFAARYQKPMKGCAHKKCNHCLRWALHWRNRIVSREYETQLRLFT